MGHALRRSPIDVCAAREEEKVVLGNAGLVEVIEVGHQVSGIRRGDLALVFCNGTPDRSGYPINIFGYDAPGTIGMLAKTTKLHARQLIPVPRHSALSLPQWAAFSLRYITAWANWNVAHACWRSQMPECPAEEVFVVGWGGGVALAELTLARFGGCQAAMITSSPERLRLLDRLGVQSIDRSRWPAEHFEAALLETTRALTAGRGVSIFVDNIGSAYRATIKALARQGVIATCGWKNSMMYPVVRSAECIARHIHVYTHYARYSEGVNAVAFACEHGWAPSLQASTYSWDEIPLLATRYAAGMIHDYFPIYTVN